MVGPLACPICRTRPPRRACGNRVFASAHCPVCLETAEPVVALPCGHALCEGCFGRIPGGALLVDGQSVGAAPRPAEDARASEAQDRDARRQRREEAARDREDAAARREAVERSRREAAEERERQREAAAARAEEVQCVICQETIRGGDQRLSCAHVFHRACLQRWLPEHRSCPVCRTPVSAAEQSAAAPARPTERGRDDPNAALYARLQAQHEEHNAEAERARRDAERARAELRAARDEAARREAARAREAAARERPSYSAAFAVNQRVEVRWRGGNQWFTGKITAIRGDRLYDILYDDGESEARVAESLIRRWVSTPHTGTPASATERARADAAEAEAKAAEERRQRRAAEAAAADKKRREAAAAAEAERRRRAANEAINAFDNYGYTKLNWAAYKGDVRKTRELLQAGADPNIIAKGDRMTPLAHAAWAGHPEIAQILLNHPWMDVKKFGKHALRMANLPMDSGTRTWASDCNFGGLEGRKAVGDMIRARCPDVDDCTCAVS